jgi:hypothetical protein
VATNKPVGDNARRRVRELRCCSDQMERTGAMKVSPAVQHRWEIRRSCTISAGL